MYVSVELLAERSSSLAAMDMAYRLHQDQHHPKNQLHLDALPAGPEDMNNLKNVKALFAARPDSEFRQDHQAFPPAGRNSGVDYVVLGKEDSRAVENGIVQRQVQSRLAGNGDGIRGGVKVDDSAVKMEIVEPRQFGEQEGQLAEEPVQFPRYVEEWGPDLPGELRSFTVCIMRLASPGSMGLYSAGYVY